MKLSTFAPLALAMASSAFAWIVNDYAEVTDCNIIDTDANEADAFFREYNGTDSNICHNFDGGEPGSTCSQHRTEGEVSNCTDDFVVSGSVTILDSPQCEFFTASDCAGSSRIVALGYCVTGEFLSFSCVSELLHLSECE